MRALRACGIDRHRRRRRTTARQTSGGSAARRSTFVHNTRYASTNSLYSLWLARDLLSDGFVVLNCDVLFHHAAAARPADRALRGCAAASSPAPRRRLLRRRDEGARARAAASPRSPRRSIAGRRRRREHRHREVRRRRAPRVLVEADAARWSPAALRDWLPARVRRLRRRRPLHAVDNRGFPWIEIDFPEDYWRACTRRAAGDRRAGRHRRPIARAPSRDDATAEPGGSSPCMNASTTCASGRSR